jgi:hypothetical protein
MRIAGCTIVSNAVRLDFPIVPAIRSLLEVCEEVVVNVGPADDGTLDLLATIRDPRLRLIRGRWDYSLGGRMLAVETNYALAAVEADWAIYLQADEVLHEADAPRLRESLAAAAHDPRIEGLLFDYLHFYGNCHRLATSRRWIRREVRAIRPGGPVESFAEAQGFRVRPTWRRVRARPTGCRVFHYGWARPIAALNSKRELDHTLYHSHGDRPMPPPIPGRLPGEIGLVPYAGSHPAVALPWIAEREGLMPPDVLPIRWTPRQVRLAVLHRLERLTGWRPFEFRNYSPL